MKWQKNIFTCLLVICLTLATGITALANESTPDPDKTGSVTVAFVDDDQPVAGGSLMLYQVAGFEIKDNAFSYVLTKDFEGFEFAEDKIKDSSFAEDLAAYVASEKIEGRKVPINDNGVAMAKNLELGLYLMIQSEAAEGYEAVKAFVFSIPMKENGEFIYDVDATPKISIECTATPSKPSRPDNPSKLPQTGQLWWPVPMMAVIGMLLFAIGWVLKRENE